MSDVKRYGFDRVEPTQKDGWAIREKPDGHLVSVTDYDSRIADIARLTERVRELEAVLKAAMEARKNSFSYYGTNQALREAIDAALAKREG